MKAMILAAGRGERMGALTATEPKSLLAVGGVPLIERQLRRLAASGFTEIVVNLSYLGARIRSRLGDGRRLGVAITYSEEGEPPLETAGGIVHALPWLGAGAFLLVNSDVYTDLDFAAFAAHAAGRNTLLLVPNPAHNPLGDFGLDEDGAVTLVEPRLTYGGVAVLDTALFASLVPGRRPLKPVLDAAIGRGELRGQFYDGLWIDVGTPERLEEARRAADSGDVEL
ncbi:MAG TPA: nucleotidyltransferase family protein [Gammaproteobacteria bacterium]|nr:nucleotidyltransferase family protein [Gammaproteobacteria bacterium]